MSTITVEVYSQGNAKKVRHFLAPLHYANNINTTEVASACTNVQTGKDSPLLRIYFTNEHQLDEVIKALEPLRTEYRMEIVRLHKTLPKLD
jgi:hypothetical protein